MSLYLEIAVGGGLYLLDGGEVINSGDGDGEGLPTVDLRALFDEPAGLPGCRILFPQRSGGAAVLIADRIVGTAEYDASEFCPVPPIGPLGALIDAVVARPADQRPALRLRGEHALTSAAAIV